MFEILGDSVFTHLPKCRVTTWSPAWGRYQRLNVRRIWQLGLVHGQPSGEPFHWCLTLGWCHVSEPFRSWCSGQRETFRAAGTKSFYTGWQIVWLRYTDQYDGPLPDKVLKTCTICYHLCVLKFDSGCLVTWGNGVIGDAAPSAAWTSFLPIFTSTGRPSFHWGTGGRKIWSNVANVELAHKNAEVASQPMCPPWISWLLACIVNWITCFYRMPECLTWFESWKGLMDVLQSRPLGGWASTRWGS